MLNGRPPSLPAPACRTAAPDCRPVRQRDERNRQRRAAPARSARHRRRRPASPPSRAAPSGRGPPRGTPPRCCARCDRRECGPAPLRRRLPSWLHAARARGTQQRIEGVLPASSSRSVTASTISSARSSRASRPGRRFRRARGRPRPSRLALAPDRRRRRRRCVARAVEGSGGTRQGWRGPARSASAAPDAPAPKTSARVSNAGWTNSTAYTPRQIATENTASATNSIVSPREASGGVRTGIIW